MQNKCLMGFLIWTSWEVLTPNFKITLLRWLFSKLTLTMTVLQGIFYFAWGGGGGGSIGFFLVIYFFSRIKKIWLFAKIIIRNMTILIWLFFWAYMTIPNMTIFWDDNMIFTVYMKKHKYDYLQYDYFFENFEIWLFAIWVFFQKLSHISLEKYE